MAYAVGCWGRTRKIGFGWAFGLSFINLFIGIIAVLCSKKIEKEEDSVEYCFEEMNKQTCVIRVPKGSVEQYKQAKEWKEFENIIEV